MKLVKPDAEYIDSFISAADEMKAEGHYHFLKADYSEEHFQEYCDAVNNLALGIGLEDGYVPETILWLIDDRDNYVGQVSIRHELTDKLNMLGGHIGYVIAPYYRGRGYGTKILALALEEAKKMGLNKVLLTCYNTNKASVKIIEKNGGESENAWYDKAKMVWVRRFWIGAE